MKQVLLAVDETAASERAAQFVDDFFTGADVAVTAVNVARTPILWATSPRYGSVPVVPYGGSYGWPWTPRTDEEAVGIAARENDRAEAVARAQAPDDAEIEVTHGDPAEAIARAADDHDADLIVVGSNHKSFLQRMLEPSVSRTLARETPRPVLVVG